MNSIWKVGAAAVTVALLGGFYLGRVAPDTGPLPAVGQPVSVGSTAEPVAETPTLRPDRTTPARPERTPTAEATDDDGDDDHGRGRGRGRGRGGDDDDVRTIGPSPSAVSPDDDDDDDEGDDDGGFDDRSGSNSGHG